MALTPNEIDVLLHFNANSQSHHPRHHSPAVGEAINRFLKEGLIEAPTTQRASDPPMPPGYFQLTGRGHALVAMLCNTPLPVAQWADPRTGVIVGGEAVAAKYFTDEQLDKMSLDDAAIAYKNCQLTNGELQRVQDRIMRKRAVDHG